MDKNYLRSLFSSSSLSPMMFLLSLLFFLSTSTVEGHGKIPAIYFFGDSYTDQGNNNYINSTYKANFLPYGKDFMGGNHPTGRVSNGKTIPDFMGGALSMPEQLQLLEEYIAKLKGIAGENKTQYILSRGIFNVVCATNDIPNYFTSERRCQYTVDSYTDFLVHLASEFIQDLYKLGARKIFIFGAPPVGCVPYQRTVKGGFFRDCSNEENEAAKLYNKKLLNALTALNDDLSDSEAHVAYVDYYNPVYNLIQNPIENGFTVANRGCCGTGLIESSFSCSPSTPTCKDEKAFVFWDSYHYTEHGNGFLVDQFLHNSFGNFL